MIRLVRRCLRHAGGTAAVEFAIISVVLIAICIAFVDFGRTLYVKNQLSYLADQATRKVLLDPDITDATLTTELRNTFTAGDANSLTVGVASSVNGANTYRIVTVGFPMTLFIPTLSSGTLNLSITRRVPAG